MFLEDQPPTETTRAPRRIFLMDLWDVVDNDEYIRVLGWVVNSEPLTIDDGTGPLVQLTNVKLPSLSCRQGQLLDCVGIFETSRQQSIPTINASFVVAISNDDLETLRWFELVSHQPTQIVRPTREEVFELIKYSERDGGIPMTDLMLLISSSTSVIGKCDTQSDLKKHVLRQIHDLQQDGLVYQNRESAYLPM
mmetsp:Transcript_25418/g.39052  ORF Transcript_25418/g.39052 Transcript_25418/m.39052 type:complete len:194 (+) Transcript_25418:34-615(+)